MNPKKKLCLIVPSLTMGGMERVMSELALYFYEHKNADVSVILLAQRDRFYVLPEGIKIYEPSFHYKKHSAAVHFFKTVFYLRNSVYKINPDSILSFCERYNSFVILSALFFKSKIFISDRSSPLASSGKIVDILNKYFYKLSKGIIAQTQIAKEILYRKNKHKNITVIGNPIKFLPRKDNAIRENIIINVGRFAHKKNQHLLLKYFKEINDLWWKIIFIGDGFRMPEVIKLSEELGLTQNVEFADRVSDIQSYYSKAKIFAFTSTSEGFPNALGEAMSAPLACISFDCVAGPKDLIDNGINGFLIKENDDKDYINKLKLLMCDEELRNCFEAEAFKKIQKYNIQTIGNSFYDFINV